MHLGGAAVVVGNVRNVDRKRALPAHVPGCCVDDALLARKRPLHIPEATCTAPPHKSAFKNIQISFKIKQQQLNEETDEGQAELYRLRMLRGVCC